MSPSIEMYRNMDLSRNFKCTSCNTLNILRVRVFIKFRLRRKLLTAKKISLVVLYYRNPWQSIPSLRKSYYENSTLMRSYLLSTDKNFSNVSKKLPRLLDPQGGNSTFIRNVGKCLPVDKANISEY